jgi:hypothetical protein
MRLSRRGHCDGGSRREAAQRVGGSNRSERSAQLRSARLPLTRLQSPRRGRPSSACCRLLNPGRNRTARLRREIARSARTRAGRRRWFRRARPSFTAGKGRHSLARSGKAVVAICRRRDTASRSVRMPLDAVVLISPRAESACQQLAAPPPRYVGRASSFHQTRLTPAEQSRTGPANGASGGRHRRARRQPVGSSPILRMATHPLGGTSARPRDASARAIAHPPKSAVTTLGEGHSPAQSRSRA